MSNDMDLDLEWLARNVSEWPEGACFIKRDRDFLDGFNISVRKDLSGRHNWTNKQEWLNARQELGLIMTEEEQEIPAEDWSGCVDADDDMVNHPPHYQLRDGYEVYDLRQDLARKAQAANVPHDQYSDWDRALEYLLRMWDKNGVEDAKKGAWYINKLIGKLEVSESWIKGINQ